jgi:DNA-binding IscR family transcriptional regulator
MEGDLATVSCLESGAKPCERMAECRTLPMWTEFLRITNEYFDSITLADLMKTDTAANYVI